MVCTLKKKIRGGVIESLKLHKGCSASYNDEIK